MDRAAIIGIGMTKIEANKVRDTFADMVWEAVNRALDDAGMTIKDIDNVITTSNDFWDGRTISCMAVGDASGVGSVGKLGNEAVSGVGMEISLSWDGMRLIDGTAAFIHRCRPGPMRCFMSSSNRLIFSRWARVLAWYSGVARSASSRRSSISRSRRCSAAF